jgi:DNA polymerase-3 subunit delta
MLVKGADAALVAQAAHRAVDELLDGRDPSVCVEEHGSALAEELDLARLVDAMTTPPFLVDRRVIVVRDAGRLTQGDVERLADVLADLPAGVVVVFVAGGGTLPAGLQKAITAGGGSVVDATVGASARDRGSFVAGRVKDSAVRLDPRAQELLASHVGEDLSRVDGVLETLASAFGEGATISEEDLDPYLGASGSLPDWDLTDAIAAGDAPRSLDVLRRVGRPAPVVVSTLQRQYLRLLRLDGSGVRTKEEAASLLSLSAYPASKALAAADALGSSRIRQAVDWIAAADADVKGATALEPEVVLEVLVARLARLHRGARPAARDGGVRRRRAAR